MIGDIFASSLTMRSRGGACRTVSVLVPWDQNDLKASEQIPYRVGPPEADDLLWKIRNWDLQKCKVIASARVWVATNLTVDL